jgi:hypothetical protein
MLMAQELALRTELCGTNCLVASRINLVWIKHDHNRLDLVASLISRVLTKPSRLDEIVASIETGDIDRLCLDEPPVDAEFGRRVSQAFASSPYITEIHFRPNSGVAMRDVITSWFSIGGETLVHITNLQKIVLYGYDYACFMSDQDWDLIYPLLLTSTSLQELRVTPYRFGNSDRVMRALALYLGAASLRNLEFVTSSSVSEAAFTSFCDGVARSSLQKLTLGHTLVGKANLETAAESLARMISESSLEEVTLEGVTRRESLCSALLGTTPIRDFDFAFRQIEFRHTFAQYGDDTNRLKINRKWKPLLVANIPLGLWPHIFEKSHTSPETSHSPEDILFFFLRQKPDLLNSTSSKLECPKAMSESPISKLR